MNRYKIWLHNKHGINSRADIPRRLFKEVLLWATSGV